MSAFADWFDRQSGVVLFVILLAFMAVMVALARQTSPTPNHRTAVLTRTLDTLPTGTIVVCYTPTHGEGIACVLDPAMQGATP